MLIDLVLTVPGAHVSHGAQTGNMNPLYWRPGQRSAVSVGGSRPNGNYFLLDGTTNTDPTFNTQNLSPSPDAVQEFKVQTGSYSAEMGGAGGGQINIVSKGGSNKFHGTAYEFLRNGFMDATSFEDMGNNHMVQNNFGASFGGPIVRDRSASRSLYSGTLGIAFKEEAGSYLHTEALQGAKSFALWPLDQAAESCFGEDVEHATAELESRGYRMLIKNKAGASGASCAMTGR